MVVARCNALIAAMRAALRSFMDVARAARRWAGERVASYVPTLWALTALLFLPTYTLFNAEMNLYDVQVKLKYLRGVSDERPMAQPRITVVAIDDAARRDDSAGRLNRMQPLSRRYLTDVVDHVARLDPSVIALDIFLDLPDDVRSDDEALLAALARARARGIRVVLAARLVQLNGASLPVLPVDEYLATADAVGHANLAATASDKVIRQGMVAHEVLSGARFWLAEPAGLVRYLNRPTLFDKVQQPAGVSVWFWSLAGAALLAQGDATLAARLRQLRDEPPFLIDFALAPRTAYAQFSSASVLADDVDAADVRHSIAIIGVAFEGSGDRHETPLSVASLRAGTWSVRGVLDAGMHGVQIQAYAIRSLAARLSRQAGSGKVAEGALACWAFGAGLLLSVAAHRRVRRLRLWPLLLVAVVFVLVCVGTFQAADLYIPISRPVLAFALAYGLVPLLKRLSVAPLDSGGSP